MHAYSRARFLDAYHSIAESCKLPGYQGRESDPLPLVKKWLEEQGNGNWLLVVDNADSYEDFFENPPATTMGYGRLQPTMTRLSEYLPKCAHGFMLVTTRNIDAAAKFATTCGIINVDRMTPAESRTLIRSYLKDHDLDDPAVSRDASRLADDLEHLPLALVQAATYIAQKSITIERYLEIYHENEQAAVDLLSEPLETDDRNPRTTAVATTWMISFDEIEKTRPDAAEMLFVMAFYDIKEIPASLLIRDGETTKHFTDSIGKLMAYSFVVASKKTKSGDPNHEESWPGIMKDSYNMHRLVNLIIRRRLATRPSPEPWLKRLGRYIVGDKILSISADTHTWSTAALKQVCDKFPEDVYKEWNTCAAYLRHAQAVLQFNLELGERGYTDTVDTLTAKVAAFQLARMELSGSESSYNQLLERRRRKYGSKDFRTLDIMQKLGIVYFKQGKYENAERTQKQVLEYSEEHDGPKYMRTLQAQSHLADAHIEQGRYAEAEKLYQDVLTNLDKINDHEDPNSNYYLRTKQNLAMLYEKQGRYEEGASCYVELLKEQEAQFGESHPDTLKTVQLLAVVVSKQGLYAKSEEMYRTTLHRQQVKLGRDHPDTLRTSRNLANILTKQAKYFEAESMYLRTIFGYRQVLGDEHPSTLGSEHNLAQLCTKQGRYDEAENRFRWVLDRKTAQLGPEHPSTLSTLQNLALACIYQKKYEEAESRFRAALSAFEGVQGVDHPDTLETVHNMGVLFEAQEKRKMAKDMYQRAAMGREKVLGPGHPDTVVSMENLKNLGALAE